LANSEEKNNTVKTIIIEENLKPFQNIIEPTPSSSNHNVQSPIPKTQTVDNTLTNNNLCLTTLSSSQYISNTNKLSAWLQGTVANNNVNNTNNLQSNKAVENIAVLTKRKLSNDHPVFNNENEDPFNYMDIDEVEEHPKKKPKKRDVDSIFFPMVGISNNKIELSKTIETNPNIAVDPKFIMNLLSEAKGTGQFIDASLPHDKSVKKYIKIVVT